MSGTALLDAFKVASALPVGNGLIVSLEFDLKKVGVVFDDLFAESLLGEGGILEQTERLVQCARNMWDILPWLVHVLSLLRASYCGKSF